MRLRWGWVAVGAAILMAGAFVLVATSEAGCSSGVDACGPDAVDRVRTWVVVVAAVAGAGWAVARAVRR